MKTWTRYGGLLAAGVLTTGILTAAKLADKIVAKDVFPDGQVRMSATTRYGTGEGSEFHSGPVVLGSVLYDATYWTPYGGGTVSDKRISRVGPGWQNYRSLDRSTFGTRATEWSLRNDGTMERRTVKTDNARIYRRLDGWLSNFRGVKGLTLISQTATYDTFLMTHSNGRLYTARFPVIGPHLMTSTVKQVRLSTWQVFETLVAAPCRQGTVVLAIDRDTGAGYLYSIGHANGLSTVVKGLGKVPGSFKDPVYFRWAKYTDPALSGE